MIRHGKIIRFSGTWSSGLAALTIENLQTGEVETIHADSGPLGRALDAAFGAAGPGHVIDNEAIRDREIVYVVDDIGLLEGFAPVEEIDPNELDRILAEQ